MSSLLPDRHPNKDFFILDVSDASPKDDMASMEHPVFSLSVKPDMRELDYSHAGRRIRVVPSGRGLATIMDKDILLYCISKLVNDLNDGREISPWVELSAHEIMVATNWNTGKRDYQRFEDALVRLGGTMILTDIPTGGGRQTHGFHLIEEFVIDRRDRDGEIGLFGRMTKVRIKLSDWTFRAIESMEVLTISAQYFRLRRPLERRIYELARKHAGVEERPFVIGIDTLQKKVGSNAPPKKFRFFLKEIIRDGHIPDYAIELDGRQVRFRRTVPVRPRPRQGRFDFAPALDVQPETIEKARRAAPGYDVYALLADWRAFAAGKAPPFNPDAAFLGFCKARHAREPLA
jgi:plasmid replication initiation protein